MPCNISIYRNLVISQVNTNNINSPWQIFEIKNLNLAPLPKTCLILFSSIMSTVQEKQFNVERINTTLQEKKVGFFSQFFIYFVWYKNVSSLFAKTFQLREAWVNYSSFQSFSP